MKKIVIGVTLFILLMLCFTIIEYVRGFINSNTLISWIILFIGWCCIAVNTIEIVGNNVLYLVGGTLCLVASIIFVAGLIV